MGEEVNDPLTELLPPQGFYKSLTVALRAEIKDGAFRFWHFLAALCWRGEPFIMPTTRERTEIYLGGLIGRDRKSVSNYIYELENAGLLVVQSTSRGYEMYPVGIVPLPFNVSQVPLDVAGDALGKNLPSDLGKNFPKSSKERKVGKKDLTSLPPKAIKAIQVAEESTPKLGKNFPKSRKKIAQPVAEFGKKLPNLPTEKELHGEIQEPSVDKSNLTPQELEYIEKLEEISLFGKNILRAVRKAIRQKITIEDLLAIAQRVLNECRTDRSLRNVYKTTAWRLANNRLIVPTTTDRERTEREEKERTYRANLIADLLDETGTG